MEKNNKSENWKLEEQLEMEKRIQEKWKSNKIWEVDAPKNKGEKEEKFMATFPYPYMNGRLHLGHAFTMTKAEFAVRVEKAKGKNAIFPFAYHCTGMPIKACADKLANEIELYGNPPQFPKEEQKEETKKSDIKLKSKVAAKSTGKKFQWQIMQSIDVPEKEIGEFADPKRWLTYFPDLATLDLNAMGSCIDWRRSFITTEMNPYYDAFVKWHFLKLKEKNKIKFGKRYTIWSSKDGQACMDHERASGEGVNPQEYTLVKLRVLEVPECLSSVPKSKREEIYLVAATLRPETMFGQTNCWVLPEGEYGAYEMKNRQIYVCSEWSAKNMSFQELFEETGKSKLLCKMKGQQLIGVALNAPLSSYERVYTLPLLSISMEKGTGIVTSVPSDSPDDYVALRDLKEKAKLREKYLVSDEWVLPFKVVPIIETPEYGSVSARTVVEEMSIKSQNDRALLEEAKEKVYKAGFYNGKFIVEQYKNEPVFKAKVLIREKLIEQGLALAYAEPESRVESRSGDTCVVALADQWYITYGEEKWKSQVVGHLQKLETFFPEVKTIFESTLAWLNGWACSRSFGLGTKLPWDPQFLIDSLSDSTIYMAYYTISHVLQGDVYGSTSSHGIKADQLTPEVFDHIFLSEPVPQDCGIAQEHLQLMQREFRYWYPLDLRVSGKDLVQNHLTFFLYNHCAIFPEEQWPLAVRANGHLQLDDNKMSKSTGNFLSLYEAVQSFSADGTRFVLAEAGDTMSDANFKRDSANKRVTQFYAELQWIEQTMEQIKQDKFEKERENCFWFDKVFLAEIRSCVKSALQHYDSTHYRLAVNSSWHSLTSSRDEYKKNTGGNMSKELTLKYCETLALLNSPIIPHFCERVWEILGKEGFVVQQLFPKVENVDSVLIESKRHLFGLLHEIRKTQSKGGKGMKNLRVYIAKEFPASVKRVMEIISRNFDHDSKKLKLEKGEIISAVFEDEIVSQQKKSLQKLVPFVLNNLQKTGDASLLSCEVTFDEHSLFTQNISLIKQELSVSNVEIVFVEDTKTSLLEPFCKSIENVRPYYPEFILY